MTTTIAERKRIEIERKFAALEAEFAHWLARSAKGEPFEKHHTQIRAARTILAGLEKNLQRVLAGAAKTGATLAQARAAEEMILAIFRLWEYFRAKLAQRNEARYLPYLRAADEFAWACYQPALQAAAEAAPRREPPLVFLNGGASPFAVSRNRAFDAEPVPGEELTRADYLQILRALPIPIVGAPWFQLSHLPDALVLGHEVGHTVEDDFNLTARLQAVLQQALDGGVPGERHAAWHAWLGELFADLYGGLATGPAFVGALIDFLAQDAAVVCRETRTKGAWDIYPTDYLRVLFNLEALREDFDDDRRRMELEWRGSYAKHELAAFEPDLLVVVPALLDATFPQFQGRRLRDVLRFTTQQHKEARLAVRQLREKETPASADLRALLAAARLAYEDRPADWNADDLLAHIQSVIRPGVRAGETIPEDEELDARDQAHAAAADRLFADLQTRLRF